MVPLDTWNFFLFIVGTPITLGDLPCTKTGKCEFLRVYIALQPDRGCCILSAHDAPPEEPLIPLWRGSSSHSPRFKDSHQHSSKGSQSPRVAVTESRCEPQWFPIAGSPKSPQLRILLPATDAFLAEMPSALTASFYGGWKTDPHLLRAW